jgi:asparagine synthase (glutamine-hydrolysing)
VIIFEGYFDLKHEIVFQTKEIGPRSLKYLGNDNSIFFELGNRLNGLFLIQGEQESGEITTTTNLSDSFKIDSDRFVDLKELANGVILDFGFQFSLNHEIRLIRNDFGTIPLFYIHSPNAFFAFSTNLSSLIKMPILKGYLQLDYHRIASYLKFNSEANRPYSTNTFFEKIKNILPGHLLTINPKTAHQEPYLNFKPHRWDQLKTKDEYVKQFRLLLENSVYRSIATGQVGAHLSGGLDSSSLSALAKHTFPNRTLHTFFGKTNTEFTKEIHHAASVATKIGSNHHEVSPSRHDFAILTSFITHSGQPRCAITSPAFQAGLIERAIENHCEILLSGHDGDSVAGNGLEYLQELLESGQWDTLYTLLKGRIDDPVHLYMFDNWNEYSDSQKFFYVKHLFIGAKLSGFMRRNGVLKALRLFLRLRSKFDLSARYFIKKTLNHFYRRYSHNSSRDLDEGILKSNFEESFKRQEFGQSIDFNIQNTSPKVQKGIYAVFNCQSVTVSEEIFTMGNFYGIDCKMPLLDRELLELSSVTPSAVKYDTGHGRGHFRSAVKDLLPDEVVSRQDKAVFTLYGRESITRLLSQAATMLSESQTLWRLVDQRKFEKFKKILQTDNLPLHLYSRAQRNILRIITLAIWIKWLETDLHIKIDEGLENHRL